MASVAAPCWRIDFDAAHSLADVGVPQASTSEPSVLPVPDGDLIPMPNALGAGLVGAVLTYWWRRRHGDGECDEEVTGGDR